MKTVKNHRLFKPDKMKELFFLELSKESKTPEPLITWIYNWCEHHIITPELEELVKYHYFLN